jgi:L-threonylcarbamoyladenylate synthase
MPTDTLYGLVGSAFSEKAINRIYKIKKRDKKKKLIILISSISDLKKFKINLTNVQNSTLNKVWPGKVSIILNNIAFRLPAKKSLIEILKRTGPLVVPSANPEGLKPAENITQAKNYFGDKVDFYVAGGTLKGEPSVLIKINNKGEIKVLRGTIKI